jgi:predicted site-specific integrase-resolvase
MEPQQLTLVKAAAVLGISPWTLRRQVYAGKVPCNISPSKRRFIPMRWIKEQLGESPKSADVRCVVYARESSSENKAAMKSQVAGLTKYATAKGYTVVGVVQEYASGVNDSRKQLGRTLKRRDFDVLLVEHKDRLSRFGFAWFETLSPFRIEVVNVAENDTHDLMEDLVAIITSFSARLYGQRRGRKKTEAAILALKDER